MAQRMNPDAFIAARWFRNIFQSGLAMKIRILIFPGFFVVALALLLPFSSTALDLLVYNTNNAGAGSLRQAINDNLALGGGNTITFLNTVTGTITLNSELLVSTNATIIGPGRDVLALNPNRVSRVFTVSSGTVFISGLTIASGQSFTEGGGISNSGSLYLSNCLFTLNFGSVGGGIYNVGTAHLSDCLFSTNNSGIGGGVYTTGTLHLSNCLFTANSGYDAGGVFSSGSLTAHGCAFIRNSVGRNGGALLNTNGIANIINCTIVSNTASPLGGGIYNEGILSLTACTIVTNDAPQAGGLYGPATVRNTIIAGNGWSNGQDSLDDVWGTCISQGYNLIGNTNASTGWGAVGDQGGTTGSPLNPDLLPLALYGGSSPIMPPRPSSPALDRGKSFGLTIDQRGRARPFDDPAVANATLGDGSDIGAVELSPVPLLVTTTNDAGPGSLRHAILNASTVDADVVTFGVNVTNTIDLTNGELIISKPLVIAGPGAPVLRISGNNSNRILHLTGGRVVLSGLSLANGLADNGGGILVDAGNHVFSQCHILSNTATFSGGGILVQSNSSLSLNSSSVTHNQALFLGGGISQNGTSLLAIQSCTIASNRTTYPPDGFIMARGGGIERTDGGLSVLNSTIAGNSSTSIGGGVANVFSPGSIAIRNSIIAGNTAPTYGADAAGSFSSDGYNLVGNAIHATGFNDSGEQLNVDPLLGPLADYGGPTPTMALRAGSPAIDKGYSATLSTDQRGFPRPLDDVNITDIADGADIGAFEVDPHLRITELRRVGNDVALSLMTVLGRNYRAEYTNDLTPGTWTIFTNNASGNGYLLWVTNYAGANQSHRFYRAAMVP